MQPSTIQVGQPARVELPGKPGVGIRVAVSGYSQGRFSLMFEEGATPPPEIAQVGGQVIVSVSSPSGLHTIAGTVVAADKRVLSVEVRGEFKTQQQRQYFRVAFTLPVLIRVAKCYDPGLVGRSDEASASDLSAGGVRLTTKLAVKLDDELKLQFSLDNDKLRPPMSFEGTVRRSVPATPSTFTVGVQFKSLSMREQDRLVAFLLKRQAGPG